MPQRFLRPGITTSDAWNAASWQAQSFYIRILTLVDDYGRYDARIPILHAHCFALRPDINPQETAALRSELQRLGLISVYAIDNKEFLQITKWQERVRGNSKYPALTDGTCVNPQETAALRSGILPPSPLAIAISHKPSCASGDAGEFDKFWASYPKKRNKGDARKVFKAMKCDQIIDRIMASLEARKRDPEWVKDGCKFVPYPARWLRASAWEDDLLPSMTAPRPVQCSTHEPEPDLSEIWGEKMRREREE